jgi:hypothetical protein
VTRQSQDFKDAGWKSEAPFAECRISAFNIRAFNIRIEKAWQ